MYIYIYIRGKNMSSNPQVMAVSLCEISLEGLIEVLISPGFLFFYVIQVEARFRSVGNRS